jgi:putative ABC transport system ATP-binding protein
MNEPESVLPTLTCSGVSKAFANGASMQQVIKPCSLHVYPGELTLIVGPSGSGKSTLLSMLSGLLRPDAGEVTALGIALWNLEENTVDRFRLEHCGFVFQGFNLFGSMTALDNVILPMQYFGASSRIARQRACIALAEVGLAQRSHLRPAQLSGGEKQRVAIARAMVKRPQLVFADEPTSSLDSTNGQLVIDLLRSSAATHKTTVLGVTHDPRLLSHADRVLTLQDGEIVDDERRSPLPSARQSGSHMTADVK